MAGKLAGKVALVTGGASGIGRACAETLAREGAFVAVTDVQEAAGAEVVAGIKKAGGHASFHRHDTTSEDDWIAIVRDLEGAHKRLDILVNNAGIALRRPTVELSLADWQAVVDVNMTAVFLCCRAAARAMLPAGGGAIVNVASIMGLSGGGLYPNVSYQSTKGAIVNMTRALAVEWAAQGIRVNAVAPTWVRTELTHGLFGNPELMERVLAMTPMRCLAEPQDVADAIAFLASDRARMITGHTLPVDGGFLAQ